MILVTELLQVIGEMRKAYTSQNVSFIFIKTCMKVKAQQKGNDER